MIAVKHSGHIGDVIYSLPAIKASAYNLGEKVTYCLRQGVVIPTDHDKGAPKAAITQAYAEFIKPLLEAQPYIERCVVFSNPAELGFPLDCDLDGFRKLPVSFYLGHLPLHYMHLTGFFTDYAQPWLSVRPEDLLPEYADSIVIGRSARNNSPHVDYRALNEVQRRLCFVGSDEEFQAMHKLIPALEHVKVANAYVLACVLASCHLFIGNSSFNFAVAEGLKKKRLFEMYLEIQSLMPCGDVRYFIDTQQLLDGINA